MSKKKRRAFPGGEVTPKKTSAQRAEQLYTGDNQTIYEGERTPGILGFFRDYGVRETIESIIIAVVLALMFRAYEAEAFIIPTGSMAPTLQGQHMDVECEKCHYNYRAGASLENYSYPQEDRDRVEYTVCPICQYKMRMARSSNPEHNSYNGDRILVNKFVYDFVPPKRFDVIVFKNPNNGKQNYIKRLIGLPNENLLIDAGDIYEVDPDGQGGWTNKRIIRKPPHKLKVMLQEIDDTDFVASDLRQVNWPMRWQDWSNDKVWQGAYSDDKPNYRAEAGDQTAWLRYRHLIPNRREWEDIESGELPKRMKSNPLGEIIGDYYCYNDREYRKRRQLPPSPGAHWVGDLALEGWIDIKSSSGTVLFDIVEGGAHFQCSVDIATGKATLSSSDASVEFESEEGEKSEAPTANTNLKGAGKYEVLFANADDRIYLWVNRKLIEFDAPCYQRGSKVLPKWSPSDAGDAEPAGIGLKNAEASVTRLKIYRDIYYTSTLDKDRIHNETTFADGVAELYPRNSVTIKKIHKDPRTWETPVGRKVFQSGKGKTDAMFPLEARQYLPMGDNSPASLDGRVWPGPKYVPEENLIGRAMFIFWPHSLRTPVPFFPNFERMGFIR